MTNHTVVKTALTAAALASMTVLVSTSGASATPPSAAGTAPHSATATTSLTGTRAVTAATWDPNGATPPPSGALGRPTQVRCVVERHGRTTYTALTFMFVLPGHWVSPVSAMVVSPLRQFGPNTTVRTQWGGTYHFAKNSKLPRSCLRG